MPTTRQHPGFDSLTKTILDYGCENKSDSVEFNSHFTRLGCYFLQNIVNDENVTEEERSDAQLYLADREHCTLEAACLYAYELVKDGDDVKESF